MRTVQLRELKRNLSSIVDRAARGEEIVITRRGRAIATLGPPDRDRVRIGPRVGRGTLEPGPRIPDCQNYLEVLQDDRRGGSDRRLVARELGPPV